MKMTNFNQLHCGGGGGDNNETKGKKNGESRSCGAPAETSRRRDGDYNEAVEGGGKTPTRPGIQPRDAG